MVMAAKNSAKNGDIMMWLLVFVPILYSLLLAAIVIINSRHPVFKPLKIKKPHFTFSLIIPYKNEEENLSALLSSIQKINYPKDKFEIIMVDDHSTDSSAKLIHNTTHIKQFTNVGRGKKQALLTGISRSKYTYIVTIDADCIIPENYLKTIDSYLGQKPYKMILGPVKLLDKPDFLTQFQQMEFMVLQAFTMAFTFIKKPFLANGANLIFDKQAFYDVEGYAGNEHIASGDDVFLLQKFNEKYPGKIAFLKSPQTIIQTQAQKSWQDLWQQKIRWASKSTHQTQRTAQVTGLLILLANAASLFSFVYFSHLYWFLVSKASIDFWLLYKTSRFYKAKIKHRHFLLGFIIYPVYYLIVLILSLKGTYNWKDQTYQ